MFAACQRCAQGYQRRDAPAEIYGRRDMEELIAVESELEARAYRESHCSVMEFVERRKRNEADGGRAVGLTVAPDLTCRVEQVFRACC